MPDNIGVLVTAPIRPANVLDKFPTAYANEIMGGLHIVHDCVERDSIPMERRSIGMLCYVIEEDATYQLKGTDSNEGWGYYTVQGVVGTIENAGGVPSIQSGPTGTVPAPGVEGRVYITTDTHMIYRDTGLEWVSVGGSKVQQSRINGNIIIDGEEKTVYSPETFVYTQSTPSNIWKIGHYLNRYPNVTIIDNLGYVVIGDVKYTDENNVVLTFSAAFAGKAYLN